MYYFFEVRKIKRSELLKILKENGFILEREGGRHSLYYNPRTGKRTVIGRHDKEIPKGTAFQILKDCDIKRGVK